MDKGILDKFLNEMLELLKTAKDFTVEQVPQVAKEILNYSLARGCLWLILGVLCLVGSIKFKKWADKWTDENPGNELLYIFVFGSFAGSVVLLICQLTEIAKITFAPRIYLIEYLAYLVRPLK